MPSAQPSSILIDFRGGSGSEQMEEVGLQDLFRDKVKLQEKSNEAIDKAMSTIEEMASRISSTIINLKNKPIGVEVEFGIKFDGELDAIIAKVGTEASMTITLKWEGEE